MIPGISEHNPRGTIQKNYVITAIFQIVLQGGVKKSPVQVFDTVTCAYLFVPIVQEMFDQHFL